MSSPSRAECRGDTANGQSWFNIWDDSACYNTYFDFIYTGEEGNQTFNEENWKESQEDFEQIFKKYLSTNTITVPGDDEYNEFQEVLRMSCTSLPGVCDTSLKPFCQPYSREKIASDGGLINYCGCYAPLPNIDSVRSVIEKDPECDPLCTRIDTIPLDDGKGNVKQCTKDVCVIDDITIEATKSSIGGGEINFNQVCTTCKPGNCICIIAGVNVSETFKEAGGEVNFDQQCGTGSECLTIQPDGTDRVVDCKTAIENGNGGGTGSGNGGIPIWVWFIVAIVIIAVIVVILFLSFRGKKKDPKVTYIHSPISIRTRDF